MTHVYEGPRYAGMAVEGHQVARPLLGPPSTRAGILHRAADLGIVLDGVPADLPVCQAVAVIRQWTPGEQGEARRLLDDLWMTIGGRARLRPPPGAPLEESITASLVRAVELLEGGADFMVGTTAILGAALARQDARRLAALEAGSW